MVRKKGEANGSTAAGGVRCKDFPYAGSLGSVWFEYNLLYSNGKLTDRVVICPFFPGWFCTEGGMKHVDPEL